MPTIKIITVLLLATAAGWMLQLISRSHAAAVIVLSPVRILSTPMPKITAPMDEVTEDAVGVGYICDTQGDRLIIIYYPLGEPQKARIQRIQNVQEEWKLWDGVTVNQKGYIVDIKTKHVRCPLSNGVYEASLSAAPRNYYIFGQCGAGMSASAEVRFHKRRIYYLERFEDCLEPPFSPVIHQIIVRPHQPVETVFD